METTKNHEFEEKFPWNLKKVRMDNVSNAGKRIADKRGFRIGSSQSLRPGKRFHNACVLHDERDGIRLPEGTKILFLVHGIIYGPNLRKRIKDKSLCVWYEEGQDRVFGEIHKPGECPRCDYRRDFTKKIELDESFNLTLSIKGKVVTALEKEEIVKELRRIVKQDRYMLEESISEAMYDEFEEDVEEELTITYQVEEE